MYKVYTIIIIYILSAGPLKPAVDDNNNYCYIGRGKRNSSVINYPTPKKGPANGRKHVAFGGPFDVCV